MIRVLLADDQALVRAGFRALLDAEQDIAVVGEAREGREALALARSARPDVVLMDIRMPELDGLAATRELAADPRSSSRPSSSTSTCSRLCAPARAAFSSRTPSRST
jgi:YesN/AraC family two-component response regulator